MSRKTGAEWRDPARSADVAALAGGDSVAGERSSCQSAGGARLMSPLLRLGARILRTADKRLLWKFVWNFGIKGMLSVERFKRRLKRGEYFPPFLYLSIVNSCNLRCQGCWVDVESPREMINIDDLNKLVRDAKKHGNSFFGVLGGEPFLHPQLLDFLGAHPDCYFQVFTNGQLITQRVAAELRRLGNVTPLVSIEGREITSDQRRGSK